MKNNKILDSGTMHEVEIVYIRPVFDSMPTIRSSSDVERIMRQVIKLNRIDYKEFFWVLLLNNSNKVLSCSEIAKGGTTGVNVNIKEIFQLILKSNATGLILCHNHPSGKLKASKSDEQITYKISAAAKVFDINLLDHIIITKESYFSFVDEGKLLASDNTLPF
jgi:DNA repair protein RadC